MVPLPTRADRPVLRPARRLTGRRNPEDPPAGGWDQTLEGCGWMPGERHRAILILTAADTAGYRSLGLREALRSIGRRYRWAIYGIEDDWVSPLRVLPQIADTLALITLIHLRSITAGHQREELSVLYDQAIGDRFGYHEPHDWPNRVPSPDGPKSPLRCHVTEMVDWSFEQPEWFKAWPPDIAAMVLLALFPKSYMGESAGHAMAIHQWKNLLRLALSGIWEDTRLVATAADQTLRSYRWIATLTSLHEHTRWPEGLTLHHLEHELAVTWDPIR